MEAPMNSLTLGLADGDLEIRADQLPSITDAQLKHWRISRDDLHRCFVHGVKLMRSRRDRARAIADQLLDGKWAVNLVVYPELTDPLMHGPASETA
jgi:hypothetical protein